MIPFHRLLGNSKHPCWVLYMVPWIWVKRDRINMNKILIDDHSHLRRNVQQDRTFLQASMRRFSRKGLDVLKQSQVTAVVDGMQTNQTDRRHC